MRNIFDYAMVSTMKRAGAAGTSANRITLLRDADGDGVAEIQEVFLEDLNQPFGMAMLDDTFYVGNTDGLVAFPYTTGSAALPRQDRHWPRSSPAGIGRAASCQARTGRSSTSGSVRPATLPRMAWKPKRAGPHLRVRSRNRQGSHLRRRSAQRGRLGMGASDRCAVDCGQRARRPGRRDAARLSDVGTRWRVLWVALLLLGADGGRQGTAGSGRWSRRRITPDYALGGHTASLGLCWLPAGTLPGFPDGMAIGQHGSWNRSKLSGYKLVFIPFENGHPAGPAQSAGRGVPPKQKHDDAITEFRKAVQLSEGSPICTANLARAYAPSGRSAEAEQLLTGLKKRSNPAYSNAAEIAMVYAALGEKAAAMAWLERGYGERFNPGVLLRPGFDSLRADPRFRDMVHRVGLTSVSLQCPSVDGRRSDLTVAARARTRRARRHSGRRRPRTTCRSGSNGAPGTHGSIARRSRPSDRPRAR